MSRMIAGVALARELLHCIQMVTAISSRLKDEPVSTAGATPFLSRAPRDGALSMIIIA
jgi:hypothetical protein